MAVDKYEIEFDKLSRFALTLVADDESKMRRFEEGLIPYIQRGLATVHSTNYDDLVDKAKSIEIIRKKTQNIEEEKPKKRGRDFEACAG